MEKKYPIKDGYPQIPEMDLILRIVSQWGNAVEMPNMEGWLKEYAAKTTPQGIGWVNCSVRMPEIKKPTKLVIVKRYELVPDVFSVRAMTPAQLADIVKFDLANFEWLDEDQPLPGRE